MGHPLRLVDPVAFYHLVSRGNDGRAIVLDAVDRSTFRRRLDQIASSFAWEVYAWCLMTTHFHVVLRAPTSSISASMQGLIGGHARTMNCRYGRTGHVFQNRFYSVEIATDRHLVSGIAYVNRNPVAARMVETADDWRDSSYRATMGIEARPGWLRVPEILELFGSTTARGRAELAALVASGRVPVSDTVTEVRRFEQYGIRGDAAALTPG